MHFILLVAGALAQSGKCYKANRVTTTTTTTTQAPPPTIAPQVRVKVIQTTTAPPAPSGTPAATIPPRNYCLDAHNQARATDGVPPLQWDDSLATSALNWSINLFTNVHALEHSGPGENLFWSSDVNFSDCNVAVKAFVDEKKFFGRNSVIDGNFHLYGHYTQVVWRGTTKVGCAVYKGYVTCHYSPAGNIVGKNPFTS